MKNLFIGLMSGTSLDGVDGVLVDFGTEAVPVRVLGHFHRPFAPALAHDLLALNAPGDNELHRAALAANDLARVCAQVVEALLSHSGTQREQVIAIGAHGQTVRHRPGEFDRTGYTIQLNAPALLAELTRIDVIADFRSRDVAAGGQGAPLVPAFHRAVFGRPHGTVLVLNVGGMSNLTVLGPGDSIAGFDCGPGNALMDHWCLLHTGLKYDDKGRWAACGQANEPLLARMLADPYFALIPPKSTGRDRFNAAWLAAQLHGLPGGRSLRPEDVQASLAELTARVCADAVLRIARDGADLLVCGGGSLNAHLLARLGAHLPGIRVAKTDVHGLPAMQVEACAFAWLAQAWTMRVNGSLGEVTGAAGPRVLGALYPAC